jgi:lincosamide nucleotidyltransferase A/C/D/E
MRSSDVLSVIQRLEAAGVRYWIDGGWGVDGLLAQETRPHSDLDLVVSRIQADAARSALAPLGFAHAPEISPGLPARVVLKNGRGLQVDLHIVVLDPQGNGWQELGPHAWGLYPEDGLRHEGWIEGRRVPCISPELQLRHHLGYEWDREDLHDMRLLAARFGLPLPPE